MKPASFEYRRPVDLDEACGMLHQSDADETRVIAGGQSLVPLMAMRLARPKRLIDIARLEEIAFIRREPDAVAIGATAKQHQLEGDPLVAAQVPLLAKVMPHVAHAPVRVRGTIGGSLANADPAAEIVLVAITLGATLVYRNGAASVQLPAHEFFTGAMMTVLPPAALLTCARFPVWAHPRIGVGFHEISARPGDFAFASAAAQVAVDEGGICRRAALGIGGICGVPLRLDPLGQMLEGRSRIDEHLIRGEVQSILADQEVFSDLHASADYRRRAAATLLARAITDALRAAKPSHHQPDSDGPAAASRVFARPNEPGSDRGRKRLVSVPSGASASSPKPTESSASRNRVELSVNGDTRAVDVESRTSLLDCLRERFLLTGTHAGCEHGLCGACTVLLDGRPIRSCLIFAVQADGHAVTTIEGVAPAPGELSPVQDAFCETHAMQCGYCTPAMILTAHALLADNPAPSRTQIVDTISGNLCRCTGYAQIVEAVALAAERMRGLNRPATTT